MFMKDDKKNKAATIIISKLRKPEMKEAPMEDGAYQDMDEMDVAIDEIMEAVEKKDKGMLKEALLSFIECASEESD